MGGMNAHPKPHMNEAFAACRSRREEEALEIAVRLRDLTLRYWSGGRPGDACRVGWQAWRLLTREAPASPLLHEVIEILRAISNDTVGEVPPPS